MRSSILARASVYFCCLAVFTACCICPQTRLRIIRYFSYTPREIESVQSLADRFAASPELLAEINDLSTDDQLTVGVAVKIPVEVEFQGATDMQGAESASRAMADPDFLDEYADSAQDATDWNWVE